MCNSNLIPIMKNQNGSLSNYLKIKTCTKRDAILRPVRVNREDASLLARWRAQEYKNFFTWVKPDLSEMLQWLGNYQTDDRQILFIVESPVGIPIGQMSLYGIDYSKKITEFGRLIRGCSHVQKNFMGSACYGLLKWGYSTLDLEKTFLEVFADNKKAVSLYERLGFVISKSLMFKRTETPDRVLQWVESDEKVSPHDRVDSNDRGKIQYREVLQMVLDRKDFSGSGFV